MEVAALHRSTHTTRTDWQTSCVEGSESFRTKRHVELGSAIMASEKNLKSVIVLLRTLANDGTMEQGQKKEIEQSIVELRRAYRSPDPEKLRKAVDRVARIFLRTHGR